MKTILLLSTALFTPTFAETAMAQQTDNTVSAQSADSKTESGGDIVVTASRRSEAASRVPVSIVATSQTSLDQRGLRDVLDLARSTPSLQVRQGGQGSNYVAIRGVTSNVGASTTGIYVDDTAIQARAIGSGNATSTAFPALFDLERVEVLRGPQGTLFGAGSEGGTVRFIQPEPSLTKYSGYARAEAAATKGGGPSGEIGAALGGPIVTDKLGFRISAYIRGDGGWVDRDPASGSGGGKKNENDRQTVSLRGALSFAATEALTITPALLYQDVDTYGSSDIWDTLSEVGSGRNVTGNEMRERGSDHFLLPSLKVAWEGDNISLVSSTSYFSRRSSLTADYTALITSSPLGGGAAVTPPGVSNFSVASVFAQKQKTFSQEIRLQNTSPGARLNWVFGAFYQNARQSATQDLVTDTAAVDAASIALNGRTLQQRFGQALLSGGRLVSLYDRVIDKQIAGFGQVDFKLLPWLKLTGGLRLANTKFIFVNTGTGPLNGGASATNGRQSESPVTPKFGVTVQIDDDNMVYGTAAKGFRTGGANAAISTAVCSTELAALGYSSAPDSYKSDSVWSYEIGSKNKLFDNRLRVAASAFYVDWSNIQQRISLSCGFSFTNNLGSAVSKGADLQVEVSPVNGFDLSASAAYTNAQYRDTVLGGITNAATGARSTIVTEGDRLPTPSWTVTLGGSYTFEADGREYYTRADYNYASSYQFLPKAPSVSYDSKLYRAEANHYLNARIGARSAGIDLSIFANNLLNSHDVIRKTHVARSASMVRELTFRPRTIGVTAGYRF